MNPEMTLIIRTPDQEVFRGSVDWVSLATQEGQLQIFPGHIGLHGTIHYTPIIFRAGENEEEFLARQGFVFVDQEQQEVSVQVYACDKRKDLDIKSIEEYRQFVLDKLAHHETLGAFQLKFLEDQKIGLEKQLDETK